MCAECRAQPLVAVVSPPALVCAGPACLGPAWTLLGIFSERWWCCFSWGLNETEMQVESDHLGKGLCGLLCSRELPPHGVPQGLGTPAAPEPSGGFSATAFRTGRQVFAGNAEGDRDPWARSASPLTTVEKPPVCMLTDPEEL